MTKYRFKSGNKTGFFDCEKASIYIDETDWVFDRCSVSTNRGLYLIFSKRCNLRCIYCFQKEDSKHPCQYSAKDIISILKLSLKDFDELVLYGGEPLLDENLRIIHEIFSLESLLPVILFTNGNISQDARKLLVENKEKIKGIVITIDGTKWVHDKMRPNPLGNSFDNALESTKILGSMGIYVQIQMNVNQRNVNEMDELIGFLENHTSFSLHLMLNPIKYMALSLSQKQLILTYIELVKKYPNVDIRVNSRLVRNLFALFAGNPLERERCALGYTAVANFSNGEVYACPQNEASKIGSINNIIEADYNRISEFMEKTKFANEKCTACEYAYLCAYACPYVIEDYDACKMGMDAALKTIFDHFEDLFSIES